MRCTGPLERVQGHDSQPTSYTHPTKSTNSLREIRNVARDEGPDRSRKHLVIFASSPSTLVPKELGSVTHSLESRKVILSTLFMDVIKFVTLWPPEFPKRPWRQAWGCRKQINSEGTPRNLEVTLSSGEECTLRQRVTATETFSKG